MDENTLLSVEFNIAEARTSKKNCSYVPNIILYMLHCEDFIVPCSYLRMKSID